MAYEYPTVQDFKDYFFRDFPFGTDPNNNILDQDVSKALNCAENDFPAGLFTSQSDFTQGVLLLSAHWLYTNIKASGGLSAQPNWITTSKAVGNVSEGFQVPQYIMDNPLLAMLSQTWYGKQYLFQILPRLAGQMFNQYGRTKP